MNYPNNWTSIRYTKRDSEDERNANTNLDARSVQDKHPS
jgi:hypothetical protein